MKDMKVCPFCGKEILAVAKMCKYCREWLPEEPTNTAKTIETENTVETEETVNVEKHTEEKTVQTPVLSKEEIDAKIEELKNERRRLKGEKMRANSEGKDVSDIVEKIIEIDHELGKLNDEKVEARKAELANSANDESFQDAEARVEAMREEIYKIEIKQKKSKNAEERAELGRKLGKLIDALHIEESAAGLHHRFDERPKSYFRKRRIKRIILAITIMIVAIVAIVWVMR